MLYYIIFYILLILIGSRGCITLNMRFFSTVLRILYYDFMCHPPQPLICFLFFFFLLFVGDLRTHSLVKDWLYLLVSLLCEYLTVNSNVTNNVWNNMEHHQHFLCFLKKRLSLFCKDGFDYFKTPTYCARSIFVYSTELSQWSLLPSYIITQIIQLWIAEFTGFDCAFLQTDRQELSGRFSSQKRFRSFNSFVIWTKYRVLRWDFINLCWCFSIQDCIKPNSIKSS